MGGDGGSHLRRQLGPVPMKWVRSRAGPPRHTRLHILYQLCHLETEWHLWAVRPDDNTLIKVIIIYLYFLYVVWLI